FADDVRTLAESQVQVSTLAEQMSGELEDPLMKQHMSTAIEQMATAVSEFQAAADAGAVAGVSSGRGAAQEAYRALLRMQSREKNVQNSQSRSQSQGSSQSRMDQQLRALELKNDRDRYETERQA